MEARLGPWWQNTRKSLAVLGFFAVLVGAMALIFIEVRVYGTGFKGKTLWDWLQLLIIPAVLALGGYLFTFTISRNERKAADRHNQTEREIAQDNQREAALQEYIDNISELLFHGNLRESQPEEEVRSIARVRTLTALPQLDGKRKRSVLQFLHESGLIHRDKKIIDLRGADLRGVNLAFTNLAFADLCETDLRGAYLIEADLQETDLSRANVSGANLSGINLGDADLWRVNFMETNLNRADLRGAELSGAYLRFADLRAAIIDGANLRYANLGFADLSFADLSGANLRGAYLYEANLKYVTGIAVEELEKQAKSL